MFSQFQRDQEEWVTLYIGDHVYHCSKSTLEADPSSVFGLMMRDDCVFRPARSTGRSYKIDRDGTHFKIILNYLRYGCHIDQYLLPSEKRYLLELLTEVRDYGIRGLEKLVVRKLETYFGRGNI